MLLRGLPVNAFLNVTGNATFFMSAALFSEAPPFFPHTISFSIVAHVLKKRLSHRPLHFGSLTYSPPPLVKQASSSCKAFDKMGLPRSVKETAVGGAAGVCFNFVYYPVDVVRTRLMVCADALTAAAASES